jgi:tetratricopeptide (TPR) repeat protein
MQSETVSLPVSDRLWVWYGTNKNRAIGIALAAIVLAAIIAGVLYARGQKEEKASKELSTLTISPASPNGKTESPEAYLKIVEAHPGTSAAERALVLAAGAYFTQGKYSEARTQFERIRRDHPGGLFVNEALLGIAASYDAEKKTNEAITAYKDITDHHSSEVVANQARFALASLYEGQGKYDQARTLFEEVARNGGSSLGSEAGMRLEELKLAHPEAFPAPASMNAPGTTAAGILNGLPPSTPGQKPSAAPSGPPQKK